MIGPGEPKGLEPASDFDVGYMTRLVDEFESKLATALCQAFNGVPQDRYHVDDPLDWVGDVIEDEADRHLCDDVFRRYSRDPIIRLPQGLQNRVERAVWLFISVLDQRTRRYAEADREDLAIVFDTQGTMQ